MNVLGISSNTYNILATLFKHIFDENEFVPRAYTLIKRALYLQWRRGRGRPGGAMAPPIVETRRNCQCCRKIVNVVGNCQRCCWGVAEDLKCWRPEKFLVCREKCSVCRKSTALGPPQKKTWVPRHHCLLNNTVILRSRTCTFTVDCSHCHIQNSLQITKTSFKVPKKM